jgi:hypothetical protein
MPPSIANVLWLTDERETGREELKQAVTTLRLVADKTQDEFFARRGFRNTSEFNKQYQRLSGVVLHHTAGNFLWHHSYARHPIPREIATTLERLPHI